MKNLSKRSADAGKCLICDAPPRQRRALARAMVVAAAADGKLAPEERGYLREGFSAIPAFQKLPTETVDRLILDACTEVAREGIEAAVVGIADDLPTPELRKTAFSLAAAVAVSDDRLRTSEVDALSLLAAALGLDDDEWKAELQRVRS